MVSQRNKCRVRVSVESEENAKMRGEYMGLQPEFGVPGTRDYLLCPGLKNAV